MGLLDPDTLEERDVEALAQAVGRCALCPSSLPPTLCPTKRPDMQKTRLSKARVISVKGIGFEGVCDSHGTAHLVTCAVLVHVC